MQDQIAGLIPPFEGIIYREAGYLGVGGGKEWQYKPDSRVPVSPKT